MTTARRPAQVLQAARRRDSETKRAHVLATLTAMIAAGKPITFTAVAKTAGVSTWLVYACGVREHIEHARTQQNRTPRPRSDTGLQASQASLKTDLALAHAQLAAMRTERDQLRTALQHDLGRQLDNASTASLAARIGELTDSNRRLAAENTQLTTANKQLELQLGETQDDLAAARASLRRMIRETSATGRVSSG